jgi:hypothetical protein
MLADAAKFCAEIARRREGCTYRQSLVEILQAANRGAENEIDRQGVKDAIKTLEGE